MSQTFLLSPTDDVRTSANKMRRYRRDRLSTILQRGKLSPTKKPSRLIGYQFGSRRIPKIPIRRSMFKNMRSCRSCSKVFRMFRNRRHHCRACGYSFWQRVCMGVYIFSKTERKRGNAEGCHGRSCFKSIAKTRAQSMSEQNIISGSDDIVSLIRA